MTMPPKNHSQSKRQLRGKVYPRTLSVSLATATVECHDPEPVVVRVAGHDMIVARVPLKASQTYYLVRSQNPYHTTRYYVVAWHEGRSGWLCSAKLDTREYYIGQAKAYILAQSHETEAGKLPASQGVTSLIPARPSRPRPVEQQEQDAATQDVSVTIQPPQPPMTVREWKEVLKRQKEVDHAYWQGLRDAARQMASNQ